MSVCCEGPKRNNLLTLALLTFKKKKRKETVAILAQVGTRPQLEPSVQNSGSRGLKPLVLELRSAGGCSWTRFSSRSAMGLASAPPQKGVFWPLVLFGFVLFRKKLYHLTWG